MFQIINCKKYSQSNTDLPFQSKHMSTNSVYQNPILYCKEFLQMNVCTINR